MSKLTPEQFVADAAKAGFTYVVSAVSATPLVYSATSITPELAERQACADMARLQEQVDVQAVMIRQYRTALESLEKTVVQLTAELAQQRAAYRELYRAACQPLVVEEATPEFPGRALWFSR